MMLRIPHPAAFAGASAWSAQRPTVRVVGVGHGEPGFTDRLGFPDVIVISFRRADECFGSAERTAPLVWSSSPADADEARVWLERELHREGFDPLDLSFMPDEELRGLVNDLYFNQAFQSHEQAVSATCPRRDKEDLVVLAFLELPPELPDELLASKK